MTAPTYLDGLLADWLETSGPAEPDALVVDRALAIASTMRQRRGLELRVAGPELWPRADSRFTFPRTLRRALALAVVAVLVLALLAAGLTWVGSMQRRLPMPFGPARNGALVYWTDGNLYVRDTVDAPSHLLIRDAEDFAAISPDGTRLLFRPAEPSCLAPCQPVAPLDPVVSNIDGANRIVLAGLGNAAVDWAPDSQRVIAVTPATDTARAQLLIVALDGSAQRRIDLGSFSPEFVAWRPPDGRTLVIRAVDGETVRLFTVDIDGSHPALQDAPGWVDGGQVPGSFAFSPDGAMVAIDSSIIDPATGAAVARIAVMAADGSGRRQIPGPSDLAVQEGGPVYSPDGRWILVHRWRSIAGSPYAANIESWLAVMPADGSQRAHDVGLHAPGVDAAVGPTWSPDGTRIVAMAETDPRTAYSVDPLTGSYERLDWTYLVPSWQRIAP